MAPIFWFNGLFIYFRWLGHLSTHNVFTLQTHATLIREKGPLPLQSAFPFEDLYRDEQKNPVIQICNSQHSHASWKKIIISPNFLSQILLIPVQLIQEVISGRHL